MSPPKSRRTSVLSPVAEADRETSSSPAQPATGPSGLAAGASPLSSFARPSPLSTESPDMAPSSSPPPPPSPTRSSSAGMNEPVSSPPLPAILDGQGSSSDPNRYAVQGASQAENPQADSSSSVSSLELRSDESFGYIDPSVVMASQGQQGAREQVESENAEQLAGGELTSDEVVGSEQSNEAPPLPQVASEQSSSVQTDSSAVVSRPSSSSSSQQSTSSTASDNVDISQVAANITPGLVGLPFVRFNAVDGLSMAGHFVLIAVLSCFLTFFPFPISIIYAGCVGTLAVWFFQRLRAQSNGASNGRDLTQRQLQQLIDETMKKRLGMPTRIFSPRTGRDVTPESLVDVLNQSNLLYMSENERRNGERMASLLEEQKRQSELIEALKKENGKMAKELKTILHYVKADVESDEERRRKKREEREARREREATGTSTGDESVSEESEYESSEEYAAPGEGFAQDSDQEEDGYMSAVEYQVEQVVNENATSLPETSVPTGGEPPAADSVGSSGAVPVTPPTAPQQVEDGLIEAPVHHNSAIINIITSPQLPPKAHGQRLFEQKCLEQSRRDKELHLRKKHARRVVKAVVVDRKPVKELIEEEDALWVQEHQELIKMGVSPARLEESLKLRNDRAVAYAKKSLAFELNREARAALALKIALDEKRAREGQHLMQQAKLKKVSEAKAKSLLPGSLSKRNLRRSSKNEKVSEDTYLGIKDLSSSEPALPLGIHILHAEQQASSPIEPMVPRGSQMLELFELAGEVSMADMESAVTVRTLSDHQISRRRVKAQRRGDIELHVLREELQAERGFVAVSSTGPVTLSPSVEEKLVQDAEEARARVAQAREVLRAHEQERERALVTEKECKARLAVAFQEKLELLSSLNTSPSSSSSTSAVPTVGACTDLVLYTPSPSPTAELLVENLVSYIISKISPAPPSRPRSYSSPPFFCGSSLLLQSPPPSPDVESFVISPTYSTPTPSPSVSLNAPSNAPGAPEGTLSDQGDGQMEYRDDGREFVDSDDESDVEDEDDDDGEDSFDAVPTGDDETDLEIVSERLRLWGVGMSGGSLLVNEAEKVDVEENVAPTVDDQDTTKKEEISAENGLVKDGRESSTVPAATTFSSPHSSTAASTSDDTAQDGPNDDVPSTPNRIPLIIETPPTPPQPKGSPRPSVIRTYSDLDPEVLEVLPKPVPESPIYAPEPVAPSPLEISENTKTLSEEIKGENMEFEKEIEAPTGQETVDEAESESEESEDETAGAMDVDNDDDESGEPAAGNVPSDGMEVDAEPEATDLDLDNAAENTMDTSEDPASPSIVTPACHDTASPNPPMPPQSSDMEGVESTGQNDVPTTSETPPNPSSANYPAEMEQDGQGNLSAGGVPPSTVTGDASLNSPPQDIPMTGNGPQFQNQAQEEEFWNSVNNLFPNLNADSNMIGSSLDNILARPTITPQSPVGPGHSNTGFPLFGAANPGTAQNVSGNLFAFGGGNGSLNGGSQTFQFTGQSSQANFFYGANGSGFNDQGNMQGFGAGDFSLPQADNVDTGFVYSPLSDVPRPDGTFYTLEEVSRMTPEQIEAAFHADAEFQNTIDQMLNNNALFGQGGNSQDAEPLNAGNPDPLSEFFDIDGASANQNGEDPQDGPDNNASFVTPTPAQPLIPASTPYDPWSPPPPSLPYDPYSPAPPNPYDPASPAVPAADEPLSPSNSTPYDPSSPAFDPATTSSASSTLPPASSLDRVAQELENEFQKYRQSGLSNLFSQQDHQALQDLAIPLTSNNLGGFNGENGSTPATQNNGGAPDLLSPISEGQEPDAMTGQPVFSQFSTGLNQFGGLGQQGADGGFQQGGMGSGHDQGHDNETANPQNADFNFNIPSAGANINNFPLMPLSNAPAFIPPPPPPSPSPPPPQNPVTPPHQPPPHHPHPPAEHQFAPGVPPPNYTGLTPEEKIANLLRAGIDSGTWSNLPSSSLTTPSAANTSSSAPAQPSTTSSSPSRPLKRSFTEVDWQPAPLDAPPARPREGRSLADAARMPTTGDGDVEMERSDDDDEDDFMNGIDQEIERMRQEALASDQGAATYTPIPPDIDPLFLQDDDEEPYGTSEEEVESVYSEEEEEEKVVVPEESSEESSSDEESSDEEEDSGDDGVRPLGQHWVGQSEDEDGDDEDEAEDDADQSGDGDQGMGEAESEERDADKSTEENSVEDGEESTEEKSSSQEDNEPRYNGVQSDYDEDSDDIHEPTIETDSDESEEENVEMRTVLRPKFQVRRTWAQSKKAKMAEQKKEFEKLEKKRREEREKMALSVVGVRRGLVKWRKISFVRA
ncbi:hypothetical protein BJ508DRAFT_363868 [Ascobolus immersus RN42]|uniref:Uncharacterized protein n=1 Tax=Ascobolus immersus RN42 TaxID=1160509 RepID=A0A3N4HXD4_ASCIM|nr:hypothetical protein BJ508DRAFT_363868 [Ascobolus immersus RN42]